MKTLDETMRQYYLDYVNNYVTVAKFAEHNLITVLEAEKLLAIGKGMHERFVRTGEPIL